MSNVAGELKNSEGKKKGRGNRYHNKNRGKSKNETVDPKKNENKVNNATNATHNNSKGRRNNKKRNREYYNYKRKAMIG